MFRQARPHMLRHSTGYKLANDGQDTRTWRIISETGIYNRPPDIWRLRLDRFKEFWIRVGESPWTLEMEDCQLQGPSGLHPPALDCPKDCNRLAFCESPWRFRTEHHGSRGPRLPQRFLPPIPAETVRKYSKCSPLTVLLRTQVRNCLLARLWLILVGAMASAIRQFLGSSAARERAPGWQWVGQRDNSRGSLAAAVISPEIPAETGPKIIQAIAADCVVANTGSILIVEWLTSEASGRTYLCRKECVHSGHRPLW
jgi:hypothetical protein